MGKCSVFCTYTSKCLKFCPFSNTSVQNCSNLCLAHSHQRTKHPMNAPPPEKNSFLGCFEMPTKNLQMSSKPLTNARHFQQKSKLDIFKIHNFKHIRKCRKHFEHFHLTPFLPLHPLKPLLCNAKKSWTSN